MHHLTFVVFNIWTAVGCAEREMLSVVVICAKSSLAIVELRMSNLSAISQKIQVTGLVLTNVVLAIILFVHYVISGLMIFKCISVTISRTIIHCHYFHQLHRQSVIQGQSWFGENTPGTAWKVMSWLTENCHAHWKGQLNWARSRKSCINLQLTWSNVLDKEKSFVHPTEPGLCIMLFEVGRLYCICNVEVHNRWHWNDHHNSWCLQRFKKYKHFGL